MGGQLVESMTGSSTTIELRRAGDRFHTAQRWLLIWELGR